MTTRSQLRELLAPAVPLVRRLRAARRRVGLCGYIMRERAHGRVVRILVSGTSTQGLAAASHAARAASIVGAEAEILVLDFVHSSVLEEALASFPAGVVARRFWREAAPGGDQAAARHCTALLTQAPVPDPRNGTWYSGYYDEGKPVLAIVEHVGATTVYYYDHTGMPVHRDEIDGRGRLIRIVDVHPATGREVRHRYMDADGACWLSVDIDPHRGAFGRARQHHPNTREYRNYRNAQAAWVTDQLNNTRRPTRIIATGKVGGTVARTIDKPYAMVHTDGSLNRHSR